MFISRLLSGIVLLGLSFLFVFVGGIPLAAVTMLLSVGAFYEMTKALGLQKEKKFTALTVIGYLSIIAFYVTLMLSDNKLWLAMCLVFSIIVMLTAYVVTFPKFNSDDVMGAVFSLVYAPLMLCFLPLTRGLEDGKYIVWMIYISSWGYDTCAYCVGMLFGKTIGNHKMFPKLSPKKSIEGTVGGIIGAAIIAWLFGHFVMAKVTGIPNVEWMLTIIAAVGAVIAQVGDLAASAVKRNKEIKDYSHLIPGHGGILDRFDSMIFTAPITYFLSVILLNVFKG